MKQSSLDIIMNKTLDNIFTSNINTQDKIELLINVKQFFTTYDETIGSVEQDTNIIDITKNRIIKR